MLTTQDIAVAVDATHTGPVRDVSSVVVDSRQAESGSMFVPVIAERDGHDFIENAISMGASSCLWARSTPPGHDITTIAVDDTLAALQLAAAQLRDRVAPTTIAVTGSVGKTSVKDLLVAILRQSSSVAFTKANFNNEIGLPLSILNSPHGSDVFVAEMGMRAKGDISTLCQIADPSIGIITKLGESHLGELGSLRAIAEAKGELVEHLPTTGTAVLDAGGEWFDFFSRRTSARVVGYGIERGDVRAESIRLDDNGLPEFVLVTDAGRFPVRLQVPGAHMAANAAAAAAAAIAYGVGIDDVITGLSGARISSMRMERRFTRNGTLLLVDCYNASPTSMVAAFDTLSAIERDGRRIAILGQMNELGPDSKRFHGEVEAEAIARKAETFSYETDLYEASPVDAKGAAKLIASLTENDTVLMKGSRSVGMESILTVLAESGLMADDVPEDRGKVSN